MADAVDNASPSIEGPKPIVASTTTNATGLAERRNRPRLLLCIPPTPRISLAEYLFYFYRAQGNEYMYNATFATSTYYPTRRARSSGTGKRVPYYVPVRIISGVSLRDEDDVDDGPGRLAADSARGTRLRLVFRLGQHASSTAQEVQVEHSLVVATVKLCLSVAHLRKLGRRRVDESVNVASSAWPCNPFLLSGMAQSLSEFPTHAETAVDAIPPGRRLPLLLLHPPHQHILPKPLLLVQKRALELLLDSRTRLTSHTPFKLSTRNDIMADAVGNASPSIEGPKPSVASTTANATGLAKRRNRPRLLLCLPPTPCITLLEYLFYFYQAQNNERDANAASTYYPKPRSTGSGKRVPYYVPVRIISGVSLRDEDEEYDGPGRYDMETIRRFAAILRCDTEVVLDPVPMPVSSVGVIGHGRPVRCEQA
uniref:Uncharacterized protein n=1 Tax=Mycena chlorophos TaxID=658473 RepID=A0ABQ0MCL7_MYCCL|nr:predicted protein [Mycena chlorophos]